MQTVSPSAVVERLEWRCAVKKFDPVRKIAPETWSALERSLVLAPSSYGLQPWHFVVVQDPKVRERLLAASWGQRQIVDASHMVVFAIRRNLGAADVDHFVRSIAATRGVPVESLDGYRKMMVGFVTKPGLDVDAWSARQLYIAIGTFLTSAAVLGVDACPMEGIVPDQYDEILGLAGKGFHALAVCCAGYRASDDAYAALKKIRFGADEVVSHV